jgi:uncharacterized protein with HEPN domain
MTGTRRSTGSLWLRAGNVHGHEYEGVDERLIWRTVRHDLAELRDVALIELDRLLVPE